MPNNAKVLGQLVGQNVVQGAQAVTGVADQGIDWVGSNIAQPMQQFFGGIGQGASEAQSKGKGQKTDTTSSVTPADDVHKALVNLIFAASAPKIFQDAQEHYALTGQLADPKAVLGNLVGSQPSQQPQTPAAPPTDAATSAPVTPTIEQTPTAAPAIPEAQQLTSIQQRAKSIAEPTSLVGKILTALPFGQGYQQTQLAALEKEQQLLGEQPLQQAEKGRAALGVATKVAEAEQVPLTKAQEAEAQARMNTAITEKENKAIGRVDDAVKALEEHRKAIWSQSNFLGKGEKIKKIDEQLNRLRAVQAHYTQKTLERDVTSPLDEKTSRFSEDDIAHTLKLHPEYTRAQLLKKLGK